jgi:transposase-like protein
MAETHEQKKKRKKQLTIAEHVQEETVIQNATEVTKVLEELKKQGHCVDIQVCPRCKSSKVERAKSTGGDMWAHIGILPPSYECPDCGWQERLVLKPPTRG